MRVWCSGNTTVSKTVDGGSIPSTFVHNYGKNRICNFDVGSIGAESHPNRVALFYVKLQGARDYE